MSYVARTFHGDRTQAVYSALGMGIPARDEQLVRLEETDDYVEISADGIPITESTSEYAISELDGKNWTVFG